jgi:signal transduction histidine kinase
LDLILGTAPESPLATGRPRESGDANALERALVEARDRIDDLESRLASQARARDELIHLVSHELRTPITVISGFGRLLQNESQGSLRPEQHRYVEECLKACRRLDRYVRDLLEACPEAGTPLSLVTEAGSLDEMISSLLESLAPFLEERGQVIETSLSGEAVVCFDTGRIEQVLTNLMTNAVRYGREGGLIRIRSRKVAREGQSPCVEVSVEDEGPGIPEADRERLFRPYVRGDKVRGDRIRGEGGQGAGVRGGSGSRCEGLGIGLAICRRIIEAHAGTIRVESSDLGGARFVFSLPIDPARTGEG